MNSNTETAGNKSVLLGLIKLMRPHQWVKNAFVLAPLIFTAQFLHLESIELVGFAMLLFCLASSATYIINDLRDIEDDRKHPKKSRRRPLASGQVNKSQALMLLALLYLMLACAWFILPQVVYVILAYMALNVAYTFVLKHKPVVDIFTIAIGFVLRVYAGAVALDVPLSSWTFVTTLCLALYLAAIKRRQELKLSGKAGRGVLKFYTISLVDRYAEMSATGALLFYSLFVMTAKPELVISIPIVLFGLFRYWFIVERKDGGESPTEALITDWPLLMTVVVWGGVCIWSLWPSA